MVSPALSLLLERARVRFGLDVEVLDARLKSMYPEGGTDLKRIIEDSPDVRRVLLEALAGGRTERLEGDGLHYRLYPLGQSPKRRQAAGFLAVRHSNADNTPYDAEPWSDLARAVVETDLAASETLADERERSRRLVGALRFLEYIAETRDESTLAEAVVQATAVWHDVDSRIYRRDLSGDLVLEAWLPGVQPDAASRRLTSDVASDVADLRRLASASELGETGAGHDALLVPMTAAPRPEWVLALIGGVPLEAEFLLRLIARAAGAQLAGFAERRGLEARQHFDSLLADTRRAPELVAVRVVHGLAETLDASAGSLSLTRKGLTRRIAAVGPAFGESVAELAEDRFSPEALSCAIPLGGEDCAALELRAAQGRTFSPDDAVVAKACTSALRTWLAGTLTSFDATAAVLDVPAEGVPAFLTRIQEELERARRFDLRLSLILLDVSAPSETMTELQEALRRELRGSDVTGAMGGSQVAALLTHTDALGLNNVVRRVRQRLADAAERLQVTDLKMGQAAFSPEVRTADALLELALRHAEPVTLH
jgi:hypothetical protein